MNREQTTHHKLHESSVVIVVIAFILIIMSRVIITNSNDAEAKMAATSQFDEGQKVVDIVTGEVGIIIEKRVICQIGSDCIRFDARFKTGVKKYLKPFEINGL